ncbi:MAG: hypothetical protein GW787_03840 [Betaproteobacteria bacterium]|nr:hypothetical protein [Betaproteobacteria bacterium]
MKPSYTLAVPDAAPNINLATKAKQVETWLAGLPNDDALAKCDLLAAYLAEHDRPDLPASFRKELLALTGQAVAEALYSLKAEFKALPLPMDGRQRDRVDRLIGLLLTVAALYQRLILDHVEYPPRRFGDHLLPGLVSGLLRVSGRILDICYLCHRQPPDGLWRDIHQTGYLIFNAHLNDVLDPAGSGATLIEIYTALLLEAAADPYHCTERTRLWIEDAIDRQGCLAQVEYADSATHKGIYGIRVDEDKPPYPLSWRMEITPACELVLNTAPLARKLALVINQMEQGRAMEQAVPAAWFQPYKALLQQLKLLWSGAMARSAPRRTSSWPARQRATLGFTAIHAQLVGGLNGGAEAGAIGFELVNESPGGIAISVDKPAFRLQVGMLILLGQGQGHRPHGLGLVRWFKTRTDGVSMLGIKLLFGQPRSVTVFPSDGRHVYPGLLLQPGNGLPENKAAPSRLILPAIRMEVDTRVDVREDTARVRLLLTERLEGSNDIALFRCRAD